MVYTKDQIWLMSSDKIIEKLYTKRVVVTTIEDDKEIVYAGIVKQIESASLRDPQTDDYLPCNIQLDSGIKITLTKIKKIEL